jgi:quercetin dioxygenase-like cupin family protein/hemerythrin-like domain-containing protein
MGYDASDFLRADHREVEDHLDKLLYALKHLSRDKVSQIRHSYGEIHRLVSTHMDEEERVFYPAVQSLVEDLLPHMLKQHDEMRETARYLGELLLEFPPSPATRDMEELYRLGIEFHDAIQVHIVDEEEQLLSRVDQHLSSEQQRDLLTALRGEISKMEQKSGSGPMRPPQPTTSPVLQFDLAQEIEQLRSEEPWPSTGRNAKTMVKYPDFRIVLTVLKADTRVQEHQTVGRISVQTVAGHIRMHVGKQMMDLPQGHLVVLDTALPHDVEALEDSAFLLTIAWPGVH